ncbi:MAG TPA: hypothetical protein PL041_04165 [Melioribacteraceae bacterium]|nr:hypothetical protein [Melioribacteraceae bacterium]
MLKKISLSILLAVMAIILGVYVVIALSEGVVHGRFDGRVYIENAPLQFWGAILLQLTIISMLVYMIVKIWKSNK